MTTLLEYVIVLLEYLDLMLSDIGQLIYKSDFLKSLETPLGMPLSQPNNLLVARDSNNFWLTIFIPFCFLLIRSEVSCMMMIYIIIL